MQKLGERVKQRGRDRGGRNITNVPAVRLALDILEGQPEAQERATLTNRYISTTIAPR
jgi:hypothetical protein